MARYHDIADAEKYGVLCTDFALRFTLIRSREGQILMLSQQVLQEARVLAYGLATDNSNREAYIQRFVDFVEGRLR